MKKIAENHTKVNIALSVLVLALVLLASIFTFITPSHVAYANEEETFSQVFPTSDYLQTSSPTLIGGNTQYLVIYDSTKSSLFVLDNTSQSTRVIDIDIKNIDNIFVLDSVALIFDDTTCHTLDLSLDTPTLTQNSSLPIDDESYITSDGTYLYIHKPSGLLSVYDSSLSPKFDADNMQSKLYGAIVIAGEQDNVYAFTSIYGITMLSTLNLTSEQTSTQRIDLTVYSAYVGDAIYALANNTLTNSTNLVCLNKQDGSVIVETSINPQSYFACQNMLYTIEDGNVCVYILDKNSLVKLTQITMTGSDEKHLNTPNDLTISKGNIIVADTLNKRLSTITSQGATTTSFEDSPLAVCSTASSINVVFENTLVKLNSSNQIEKTYSVANILDVVYLDKLYILTNDGVYTLIGDTLLPLASIENAKRITSAIDGKNIYVLTDSEILSITQQGKVLPHSIEGDFKDAVDIAVDYEGKVFVAYKNEIHTYLRDDKHVISVKNDTLDATLTSICLSGEKLYFTASESFVGVMDVDAKTKSTYIPTQVDISSCTQYEFTLPKQNALYYSIDGRCDNKTFADNTTLLLLKDVQCEDGYAYALNSNTIVKISLSEFDTAQTTTLSGDYVTTEQATLYTLPYQNADTMSVEADTHITLISDVAGYDNNVWVLAEYESKTYFVKKALLQEYVEPIPEVKEDDKVYGKANADRVGGMVSIYTSADIESDVVYEIVDGSRVEVLDEVDDFYLVTIDEYVGYIQKDQLKIEGLTTVQIVAIILSIIVALAGIAIFASIYLTKKNNEEKEKSGKFIR